MITKITMHIEHLNANRQKSFNLKITLKSKFKIQMSKTTKIYIYSQQFAVRICYPHIFLKSFIYCSNKKQRRVLRFLGINPIFLKDLFQRKVFNVWFPISNRKFKFPRTYEFSVSTPRCVYVISELICSNSRFSRHTRSLAMASSALRSSGSFLVLIELFDEHTAENE